MDGNIARHLQDQPSADAQTETNALLVEAFGVINPVEVNEELIDLVRSNPAAEVFDAHVQVDVVCFALSIYLFDLSNPTLFFDRVFNLKCNNDFLAFAGVLESIGEEVYQNLAVPALVTVDLLKVLLFVLDNDLNVNTLP